MRAEGQTLEWQRISARATITKYHRLGDLSNTSGGWKSQVKMAVGLLFPEASVLGLPIFPLCHSVVFPLCVSVFTRHTGLGSTSLASF